MKQRPKPPRALGLAALTAVIVCVAAMWFGWTAYGSRSLPAAPADVVIPDGSSLGEIADILADRHVIADPFTFRMLAKMEGVAAKARAGEFRFEPHLSEDEVLDRLVSGGAAVAVWVTIPEGYTATQIARAIAAHGLGDEGTFADAFLHTSTAIDGERTVNLEGFLFPDTYLFPRTLSPDTAERIMLDQFRAQLPHDAGEQARRLGYTIPQVVTIASLIEREAKADDERARMAGVYYNRLRLDMPLQVDATIEYALPEHKAELSRSDLDIDSPYNTYKYGGLPPTPIACPGAASLRAAFHPERTPFLYYVYMGNGHHAFARTLAEHNANVARYLHE